MSLSKTQKSLGREHRERGQLVERKHLGLLEKRKDWLTRTRAHQKKSRKLKKYRKRALEKNTDAFDFGMTRAQVGLDGLHREATDLDAEQSFVQSLFKDITDINYLRHKLNLERKKIQKLKAELHMTDSSQKNTHTLFLDEDEEVDDLDPAERFGTTAELLDRRCNRLPVARLQSADVQVEDKATALDAEKQRHARYAELRDRLAREKELAVALAKLEVKKAVAESKGSKPKLVSAATTATPACFKWKFERKR